MLEVLIRKGVLTPEEAEKIQREAKDLEKTQEWLMAVFFHQLRLRGQAGPAVRVHLLVSAVL